MTSTNISVNEINKASREDLHNSATKFCCGKSCILNGCGNVLENAIKLVQETRKPFQHFSSQEFKNYMRVKIEYCLKKSDKGYMM